MEGVWESYEEFIEFKVEHNLTLDQGYVYFKPENIVHFSDKEVRVEVPGSGENKTFEVDDPDKFVETVGKLTKIGMKPLEKFLAMGHDVTSLVKEHFQQNYCFMPDSSFVVFYAVNDRLVGLVNPKRWPKGSFFVLDKINIKVSQIKEVEITEVYVNEYGAGCLVEAKDLVFDMTDSRPIHLAWRFTTSNFGATTVKTLFIDEFSGQQWYYPKWERSTHKFRSESEIEALDQLFASFFADVQFGFESDAGLAKDLLQSRLRRGKKYEITIDEYQKYFSKIKRWFTKKQLPDAAADMINNSVVSVGDVHRVYENEAGNTTESLWKQTARTKLDLYTYFLDMLDQVPSSLLRGEDDREFFRNLFSDIIFTKLNSEKIAIERESGGYNTPPPLPVTNAVSDKETPVADNNHGKVVSRKDIPPSVAGPLQDLANSLGANGVTLESGDAKLEVPPSLPKE